MIDFDLPGPELNESTLAIPVPVHEEQPSGSGHPSSN